MAPTPAPLGPFPPEVDLDTPAVLGKLVEAGRALAELQGTARAIPNQGILISALVLQEAWDSSRIENIVTTQDALYRRQNAPEDPADAPTEQAFRHVHALHQGHHYIKERDEISIRLMADMCGTITGGRGIRGGQVELRNPLGEVVYTPPGPADVPRLMQGLEAYINDPDPALDPLVRMALIHHRFESIHPFLDGNGRVGRIVSILYLCLAGLLDAPILHLSREIHDTKGEYYRLLQQAREESAWEEWCVYMLDCVGKSARRTLRLVQGMGDLMQQYKEKLRAIPKIYSQDLLNSLFRHPYSRIETTAQETGATYATARRRLHSLADHGLVHKARHGRHTYYVNQRLVDLLRAP